MLKCCNSPGSGRYDSLHFEQTTQATGVLTLANTMGAAMGSGVATFILLPLIGIENSILILALGYILIALVIYLNRLQAISLRRGEILQRLPMFFGPSI